jgi:hypothetical protein
MNAFAQRQTDRLIRDRIFDMSPAARMPFLLGALVDGDMATIRAVLAGQSFHSGLTDKQHETIRVLETIRNPL